MKALIAKVLVPAFFAVAVVMVYSPTQAVARETGGSYCGGVPSNGCCDCDGGVAGNSCEANNDSGYFECSSSGCPTVQAKCKVN